MVYLVLMVLLLCRLVSEKVQCSFIVCMRKCIVLGLLLKGSTLVKFSLTSSFQKLTLLAFKQDSVSRKDCANKTCQKIEGLYNTNN